MFAGVCLPAKGSYMNRGRYVILCSQSAECISNACDVASDHPRFMASGGQRFTEAPHKLLVNLSLSLSPSLSIYLSLSLSLPLCPSISLSSISLSRSRSHSLSLFAHVRTFGHASRTIPTYRTAARQSALNYLLYVIYIYTHI